MRRACAEASRRSATAARRPVVGAILCASLLGTAVVRAQPQEPRAPGDRPQAAEDATTTAAAEPAGISEEEVRARARALFEEGIRLLEIEDWEAAVRSFAASYELRPNPNVLYNLANGQRLLFDYPAAIASFRRYLAMEGDRVSVERRAEVEGFLAEMLSKVGTVTVAAPEGSAIAVDGRLVGTAPLDEPLLVTAEEHVVTAEREGHAPAVQRIHPGRGELLQVILAPQVLEAGTGAGTTTAAATTAAGGQGSGESPAPVPALTLAEEGWGRVPVGLGVAANLRALDFEHRAFLDNFGWSVHGGFRFVDWFTAVLELSFPAVDFALWARFAFLRLDWFALAAAPGLVLTSGALDDRGVGFAACLELRFEFRVWRGLTLFLAPGAGIDALRATWVVPLALGTAYAF